MDFFVTFLTGILLLAIIIYAVLGGADFGYGIWDLFTAGPDARRQRRALTNAVHPLMEFNHVWLIVVVVLLFTVFPPAFYIVMVALFIPLNLVIVGIIFRGVALIFRDYDETVNYARWSRVYGISSLLTAFLLGAGLASASTDAITIDSEGLVTSGYFAGWTTPFALVGGLFAVAFCAFMAALSLTLDGRRHLELQELFRERALRTGTALAVLLPLLLLLTFRDAPLLADGFATPVVLLSLLAALGAGFVAFTGLRTRRLPRAWITGPLAGALLVLAWGLAQYPRLLPNGPTVEQAASPEGTLQMVSVAVVLGLLAITPAVVLLVRTFKLADDPVELRTIR